MGGMATHGCGSWNLRGSNHDDCLSARVATNDAARGAPEEKRRVQGHARQRAEERPGLGSPIRRRQSVQLIDMVLSSNVTLGADRPTDPGVTVWLTLGARSMHPR